MLSVVDGEYNIGPGDYNRAYETLFVERKVFKGIKDGKNNLSRKELMENDNNDGFARTHVFKLTDKALTILLPEYANMEDANSMLSRSGLVEPETVKEKYLFYNTQEQHQIDTLCNLLDGHPSQPYHTGSLQHGR